MSDHTTSFPDDVDPDDELVSAVLDGEATAAERAQMEGSARLQQRLLELRAASALAATPVTPLSPDDADGLLARVLAAADDAQADTVDEVATADDAPETEGQSDNVVAPLLRPRTTRKLPPRWLVAAVVIALMATGATMMFSSPKSSHSNTASTAAEADKAAGGPLTTQSPKGTRVLTYSNGTSTLNITYVGSFANTAQLRQALNSRDRVALSNVTNELSSATATAPTASGAPGPGPGPTTTTNARYDQSQGSSADRSAGSSSTSPPAPTDIGQAQIDRCDHFVRATDTTLETPTGVGTAYLDNRPVILLVYPVTDTPGAVRQFVVDAATCDVKDAVQR